MIKKVSGGIREEDPARKVSIRSWSIIEAALEANYGAQRGNVSCRSIFSKK